MSKAKIYRAKEKDPNSYAKMGWDLMPINATGGNIVVFKNIKLDKDDNLVRELINTYNKMERYYDSKIKNYIYRLGIRYTPIYDDNTNTKRNELILDDKAYKGLCSWRFEIDLDENDSLLHMAPLDITFPNPIYPYKILKPYVEKELKEELEKGMIKAGFAENEG